MKVISARRLGKKKFPPTEYFVERLLVPGVTVLAGKPKRGKSVLALSIALAVAKGQSLFGELKTSQHEVLFLGLEDSLARLDRRLKEMTSQLPCRLKLSTNLRRLDEGGFDQLEEYLAKRPGCRLIIIDTLAQVRPPIAKPSLMYQEEISLGRKLKAFAKKHNAALILNHHSTKKEFQGDVTSSVLGSTGITAAADTVMLWDRDHGSKQGVLRITGRDVEEDEWTLDFRRNKRRWKWTILDHGDSRGLSPQQTTILSILAKSHRPLGPRIIANKGALSYGSTRVILRKMVDAMRVKCMNHRYSLESN